MGARASENEREREKKDLWKKPGSVAPCSATQTSKRQLSCALKALPACPYLTYSGLEKGACCSLLMLVREDAPCITLAKYELLRTNSRHMAGIDRPHHPSSTARVQPEPRLGCACDHCQGCGCHPRRHRGISVTLYHISILYVAVRMERTDVVR